MTVFASFASLLAVLALALLTRPLWNKRRALASSLDDGSLGALRAQLNQLAGLHASGVLGETPYTEARAALERRIVDRVTSAPADAADREPAVSKALMPGLVAFVCLTAAAGYALLGTPQGLKPEPAQAGPGTAASEGSHPVTSAQIESMIDKLSARLKERPDDADGWAMIGRSYAVLGKHDQAVPAFKQAAALRPDDAVLLADYADALAVVNGRNLEGEPSRLIEQSLKIDPNGQKALSLAGTAAFDRGDHAGALRHWEKLKQIAPDSQFAQQIQSGIDEARQRMGGPAPKSASVAAASGSAKASAAALDATISGTVTLDAALAGQAGPEDTLFVFARPADGSRMPLAILRKQVKDLPLTFTLDDSMAMSPAARLSGATRVVVGARISKGGDAIAKPGDLQGVSVPMEVGARGLKIEISERVGS